MEKLDLIISISTIILTILLGVISKKSKFINTNLIPIQNLLIGVIVAIVEFIITKDFSIALSLSGLMAGGTYDIMHNLNKMFEESKLDINENIESEE